MEFTNEMIEKAKEAGSAEELLAMAKEAGMELSEADAEKYYGFLHTEGELSDDELTQVAGGKGNPPRPKYSKGQKVRVLVTKGLTSKYVDGYINEIDHTFEGGQYRYFYWVYIYEYNYALRLELEKMEHQLI